MAKQALIYENATPIIKDRHARWKVAQDKEYSFARDLNAVPLTTTEFAVASRELPIVFAKTGETYSTSVLIGLRDKENLCVDDAGKWRGNYVPAFLRRYPFVFAHNAEEGTYTLCIDEASAAAGEAIAGERLFDESGQETPYLQNMLKFNTAWQRAFQDSADFCKRLVDMNLLDDSEIRFPLPDGTKASIRGFAIIDQKRFRELDATAVHGMFSNGDLELIFSHIASLRGIEDLSKRL